MRRTYVDYFRATLTLEFSWPAGDSSPTLRTLRDYRTGREVTNVAVLCEVARQHGMAVGL